MKILNKDILGALALFLLANTAAFAIEGLQVSLQSSNVVLAWPSEPSETFIAQYRPSLTSTSDWVTLTNFLPAQAETNLTLFIHSNSVQYGSAGSGGGGGSGSMIPTNGTSGGGSSFTNASAGTGFYRVVRNGAHIYGLTNGMVLQGTVRLPIELALDTTNEIAGVTFYANGAPLIGASAEGEGYAWVLQWDTAMMRNGNYDLTAQVDFVSQDEVTNTVPVTLTVSNAISFPNYFTRIYGEQMWVYAELTTPVADFQIDMFDENTNYLGSFAGDTSDGVISFTWDLTDGNGHSFNSTNFFGVFTVTPSQNRSGIHRLADENPSTAKQTWAKEENWASNDKFAIAYAPLDSNPTTSLRINNMVANGVVDTLYNIYQINGGNIPLGNTAFGVYGASEKGALVGHLADLSYRNFYFFGHGSPYAIAGISKDTLIKFSELGRLLNNNFLTTKPANAHPYRLVFIDGCLAGKANFSEAFGIPAQTVNNAFFAIAGVRSRAFLGFTSTTSFNPPQWEFRANMLAKFWSDWVIDGVTLGTAVNNAKNFGTGAMDASAIIYGATDLRKSSP